MSLPVSARPAVMRRNLSLVLGVLMVGLGLYALAWPLLTGGGPVSTSRWLDLGFAAFFLIRGAIYLRAWRRATRQLPH